MAKNALFALPVCDLIPVHYTKKRREKRTKKGKECERGKRRRRGGELTVMTNVFFLKQKAFFLYLEKPMMVNMNMNKLMISMYIDSAPRM